MPKESTTTSDLLLIRDQIVRHELKRFILGSYALIAIGFIALLFIVFTIVADQGKLKWETISLLVFTTLCFCLPLFQKFQFGKDSAGFEMAKPLEIIEKIMNEKSAKAEDARLELFQETRQQISNLSVQINELNDKITNLSNVRDTSLDDRKIHASSGATSDQAADVEEDADLSEPTVESLKKSLPAVIHEDDPQKDRFGGAEDVDGRRIVALFEPSAVRSDWQKIRFKIEVQNRRPLAGRYAYFFIHDTFEPDFYRVPIDKTGSSATLTIQAYGAFTIGAIVDRGKTRLELDLATSKNVTAPSAWRRR